jgi:hypothetical protein
LLRGATSLRRALRHHPSRPAGTCSRGAGLRRQEDKMKYVLFAIAGVLERAPLARYHSLRALGSDLYYVATYGGGRYPGGAWWYQWPAGVRRGNWWLPSPPTCRLWPTEYCR